MKPEQMPAYLAWFKAAIELQRAKHAAGATEPADIEWLIGCADQAANLIETFMRESSMIKMAGLMDEVDA